MNYAFVSQHLGRFGLAAILLATAPLVAASEQAPARDRWHEAIGEGYSQLATETQALATHASNYCETSSSESRATLEASWLDAYQSWQRVRFVNFGPIEQQSRAWQIQFWPDRKNLVGRKVENWLKADTSPSIEAIANDSVAIQGFPAMEYLLFDERLSEPGALAEPKACDLLLAISTHLAATTQALQHDWQTFGEHYRDTQSYTAATLEAGFQTLDTLETKRLAQPIGLAGSAANAYLAEAWRSERSIKLIAASLVGLDDIFLPGLRTLLNDAGQQRLADTFAEALDDARRQANQMGAGLAPALEDPDAFADLQRLYINVGQLNRLSREVVTALGLTRGFNSSDGD
ncbi:imelysin family protein [Vreelandella salicampi]|uniref:Imelysin family protein n=1 Tax=Vreelandella salicampi TaxID=1449798 RepID=A0A7Z0RU38_9GAMM|nr:imelysin family protein [Halomonas salicampi]NYS60069.1 imelysin family protein [Halomonas salicampi]